MPTRAARSRSGSAPSSSRTLAVGGDQLHRLDLGGDVAQLRAGAVGAGRDRPGDRLAVDVAEVLHRQPEPVQLLVEVGEHRARPDPDQARGRVGVDHAAERGDVDHRAVGQRRLGEGVAGAGDAHLATGRRRRSRSPPPARRGRAAARPPPAGSAGPPSSCARCRHRPAYATSSRRRWISGGASER